MLSLVQTLAQQSGGSNPKLSALCRHLESQLRGLQVRTMLLVLLLVMLAVLVLLVLVRVVVVVLLTLLSCCSTRRKPSCSGWCPCTSRR